MKTPVKHWEEILRILENWEEVEKYRMTAFDFFVKGWNYARKIS